MILSRFPAGVRTRTHLVMNDTLPGWIVWPGLATGGLEVEVTLAHLYSCAREMMAEVVTGNLRVHAAAGDNYCLFFTGAGNDPFRAVHNYFGHFATDRGFDQHGEEGAFQANGRIFSDCARLTAATESRQHNAGLITSGSYPEQKLIIRPGRLNGLAYLPGNAAEHRAAQAQAAESCAGQFSC